MQEWLKKALSLPQAVADNPFGAGSICVRIGPHGPIFASFMPAKNWVSFRCERQQGQAWRAAFPDAVRRGYHCPPVQQPYNNTVTLDGSVPEECLHEMLLHSYERAKRSMSKAARAALGL